MYIDNNELEFTEKHFSTKKKEYIPESEVNFNSDNQSFDNRVSVESSKPDLAETSNGIEG